MTEIMTDLSQTSLATAVKANLYAFFSLDAKFRRSHRPRQPAWLQLAYQHCPSLVQRDAQHPASSGRRQPRY